MIEAWLVLMLRELAGVDVYYHEQPSDQLTRSITYRRIWTRNAVDYMNDHSKVEQVLFRVTRHESDVNMLLDDGDFLAKCHSYLGSDADNHAGKKPLNMSIVVTGEDWHNPENGWWERDYDVTISWKRDFVTISPMA